MNSMFCRYRSVAAVIALILWCSVPSLAFEMTKPNTIRRLRHHGYNRGSTGLVSLPNHRNSIAAAVSRDENESSSEAQENNDKSNILAALLTEYGLIFVLFHYAVFFIVWAAFYVLLRLGLTEEAARVPGFLGKYLPAVEADSTNGELVAASFFLMELVGPARSALDIVATPIIARELRKSPRWTSFENEVGTWWDQSVFRNRNQAD